MPALSPHTIYPPAIAAAVGTLPYNRQARLATAAALASNTYNATTLQLTASSNGALTVDGVTVAQGDPILVTQEATGKNNGLYVVTQTGSGSLPYILTRSAHMNTSADLLTGLPIAIGSEGTTNPSCCYILTTAQGATLDTTALTFVKTESALGYNSPLAQFNKSAADGAAATTTAETIFGKVGPGSGGTIGAVYFTPAASLTANDSNYATIQVQKRTAGGAPTTVAQATTQTSGGGGTGSWTAWKPVAIAISAGAVSALDALTFNIGKTGTGVVVPAGQLNVYAS